MSEPTKEACWTHPHYLALVEAVRSQWLEILRQAAEVRRLRSEVDTARRDEREACARLAETLPFRESRMDDCRSADIAAAIRARGTT